MDDRTYLELVDLCYASLDDPGHWQDVTGTLTRHLRADAADIAIEHYDRGVARPLGTLGFDPHFRDSYDVEFLGENPWISQLSLFPVCRSATSEHEPEDFEKSAYYNEWLRPQRLRHGVGAIVDENASRVVHIGFVRRREHDPFVTADAGSLERILPHVRRAVRAGELLCMAEGAAASLLTLVDRLVMPALVFDAGSALLHANAAASDFLRQAACGLHLGNDRLRATDHATNRRLQSALAAAARVDLLAVGDGRLEVVVPRARHGLPPFVVHVISLRGHPVPGMRQPSCLAILSDPLRPLPEQQPLIRAVWNLTETEAKLAWALAGGETVAGYAAAAGISVSTARWHLKNVEAKMDAHTAEGVVRLVRSTILNL